MHALARGIDHHESISQLQCARMLIIVHFVLFAAISQDNLVQEHRPASVGVSSCSSI